MQEKQVTREFECIPADVENKAQKAGSPSYKFNVGDKVYFGGFIDCVVDKVFAGGLVYGIAGKHKIRDKLFDTWMYAPWIDVRPVVDTPARPFSCAETIKLHFQNYTVESLMFRALCFGVDFDPDYQRGRVWDEKDQESLLDSIFMGADIGKFVFRSRSNAEWGRDNISYEIIDGKQRLLTLLDFYANRFSYRGVSYNDLCRADKRVFLDTPVAIADFNTCDRVKVLSVFLRLNRGGRPVSAEVIQHAEALLALEKEKEG